MATEAGKCQVLDAKRRKASVIHSTQQLSGWSGEQEPSEKHGNITSQ